MSKTVREERLRWVRPIATKKYTANAANNLYNIVRSDNVIQIVFLALSLFPLFFVFHFLLLSFLVFPCSIFFLFFLTPNARLDRKIG
jgi:hypothetical protein